MNLENPQMTNVYRFPIRKSTLDAATRLKVRVPHDETGPLLVTIPDATASGIRRSALWARKHPTQFVIDWLSAGFDSSERPA
jgi:hypothetical protein